MSAFKNSIEHSINEAISNIIFGMIDLDCLIIRRNLWEQIFIYKNNKGELIEITTSLEELKYTDYDKDLMYIDSFIDSKST